jgi:hypothetical protein
MESPLQHLALARNWQFQVMVPSNTVERFISPFTDDGWQSRQRLVRRSPAGCSTNGWFCLH